MHGPTMPLVPLAQLLARTGACFRPRPCGSTTASAGTCYSSAINCTGETPLARAWPWPRCRAEHDIVALEVCAHADCDRFLTDISVARAVNEAALVRLRQLLLLSPADEYHLAIVYARAVRLRGRLCHPIRHSFTLGALAPRTIDTEHRAKGEGRSEEH